MSNTSGRFSRYPAVNRDVPSGTSATPTPAPEPEPELAPEPAPAPEPTPEPEVVEEEVVVEDDVLDFSEMTIDEIVDWVDGDPTRREQALAGEAAGKNRSSLPKRLAD